MIIITGPGRSGTSVIAQIYKDLGFDPGGEWVAKIHGGLEPREIVEVNEELLEALGLTPMGAPGGTRRRIRHAGKALIPAGLRPGLRSRLQWLPWMGNAQPGMLRWERFDAVAETFAPRLRELAERHPVAKDPRWFWTLPLWVAAGVPIEHVLVSIRNLEAVVQSRGRMGSLRFRTAGGAKNSITYGLGLTMLAIHEHQLSHAVVRFPEFLDKPKELYGSVRFPRPVLEADFCAVVERLRRPDLVHDRR